MPQNPVIAAVDFIITFPQRVAKDYRDFTANKQMVRQWQKDYKAAQLRGDITYHRFWDTRSKSFEHIENNPRNESLINNMLADDRFRLVDDNYILLHGI